MNINRTDWSRKLDDAILAYYTVVQSLIGISSYQFICGKSCHFPDKLEHKDIWETKNVNID